MSDWTLSIISYCYYYCSTRGDNGGNISFSMLSDKGLLLFCTNSFQKETTNVFQQQIALRGILFQNFSRRNLEKIRTYILFMRISTVMISTLCLAGSMVCVYISTFMVNHHNFHLCGLFVNSLMLLNIRMFS